MPKKLVVVCLINFLIAAGLGLVLRFIYISPLPINYQYLTHAHSHIAMLGWVYLMLYMFLVHYFVPEYKPIYTKLFWLTEFAVIGMLLSFPFQGYAAISITFSTLHIFCSYYFVYCIWKDFQIENTLVKHLVKTALTFMLLSTLGVWCLGPAVGLMGKTSAFYQIAIQFFLHFQFNGWFLIACIAILFYGLGIKCSKDSNIFFKTILAATVLTLALPIIWFAFHPILYWLNGLGIILQVVALYYFLKIIIPKWSEHLSNTPKIIKLIYGFALLCFILKIGFQTVSIIPEFALKIHIYRNFVIGFIHLLMLGVISGFLLAFLLQSNIIKPTTTVKAGLYSFILGFILTEGIICLQGCLFYLQEDLIPNYYLLLFIASILLPLGIACIVINYIKQNHETKTT